MTLRVTRAATGPLRFRPLDPTADAALLHDWVNRPHARFWNQQGKTLAEVETIYREQIARGQDLLLACREDTDEPLLLLWRYDPRRDVLARHYRAQPGDIGFHFFQAPVERATPGLSYQLMTAAIEALFADPAVQRIVGEPDLRNQKILTRLLQAGFRRERVVHLPHKTAALVTFPRSRFEAGLPDVAPPRPTLHAWPLRVRWHFELGRIARAWQRLRPA